MKRIVLGILITTLGSVLLIPKSGEAESKHYAEAKEIPRNLSIEIIELGDSKEPVQEVREFTYEEAQMLMRIAQAEAGNQGIEGMELVMAVVLNRVESENFPNTIEEVIFQPNQFQPVSDGRYYEVELSSEVHQALANVEKGNALDEEIIGFEITADKSLEQYFSYAYTVGDHDFYTEK